MNQKLRNYPFWCLCLLFCLGVFISSFSTNLLVGSCITSCFLFLFLCFFYKKTYTNIIFYSCGGLFLLLGVIRHQIADYKYIPNHISSFDNRDVLRPAKLTFSISRTLKPSAKAFNYIVNIRSINNKKTEGSALLTILKKDSLTTLLESGNSFAVYSKLKPLTYSKNPFAFEYTDYLKNLGITHKIWTTPEQLYSITFPKNFFIHFSNKLKNYLEKNLRKQQLPPKALQLTEALVLGNKHSISNELKQDFSKAGVIHILAISGLHIGIIYLILNGIFSIVFPFSKNNIYTAIVITILLWSFALFSGGSPSALRATTMFTCFQITKSILRQQHPINSLLLSVFILTFINPNILFSVGFQLSVSAVGAIILGTPKLFAFWFPENYFTNKIWSIFCISICAQIGVFPLSIYYFNQFSTLFLLANIPVMLLVVFLLSGAIIVVISSAFITIPKSLIYPYNEFVLLVTDYIHWVASFDSFVLKELYINKVSLVCCYLFGLFLFLLFKYPRRSKKWSLLAFPIFLFFFLLELNQNSMKDELWLLNDFKNTIIVELTSNKLNVHSLKTLSKNNINFLINPIKGNLHYSEISNYTLKNNYLYKGIKINIINSKKQILPLSKSGVYILNNSPKINLERIIQEHKPKLIIASKSNYLNLIQKWKATCSKEQVAFYNISQNGAINLTDILSTL